MSAALAAVALALPFGVVGVPEIAVRDAAASELQFRAGTPSDRDGDGVDNVLDGDDDNDLIADVDEPSGDADGDGVANVFDTDADNDGIADLVEAIGDRALLERLDADGDGLLDEGIALGANGMADLAETAAESGAFTTGRVDTDGDGVPDPYDLDSDNDGLADVVEAGGTDTDGDARVDRFRDFDDDGRDDQLSIFPIVPRDTDGDGVFDFRDVDSDGDGASDRRESSGVDTDGDGVVDGFRDADGDGLDDATAGRPVTPVDANGDRLPDYLDAGVVSVDVVVPPDSSEPQDPSGPLPGEPADPDRDGSGNGSVPPGGTVDVGAGRPVTGRAGNPLVGCSIGTAGASTLAGDVSLAALLALALCVLGARGRRGPAPFRRAGSTGVAAIALALGGCASFPPPRDGFGMKTLHVGAGVGASRLDADTDGTTFVADERVSASAQLTLGATLAPWLDAEARAADLGELSFDGGGAVGYQIVDVSAVLRRERGPLVGFARTGVGVLFNDGDVDVERRNPVHLLLGAGVDAPIGDDWSVRLEASGHDLDAVHGNVGVLYRFGRAPSPRLPGAGVVVADSPAPDTVALAETEGGAAASPVVANDGAGEEERDGLNDDRSDGRDAGPGDGDGRRDDRDDGRDDDGIDDENADRRERAGLLIEPIGTRPPRVARADRPLPDITPLPRFGETAAEGAPRGLRAPSPDESAPFPATQPFDAVSIEPVAESATDPDEASAAVEPLVISLSEPFDASVYDIRFERGSARLTEAAIGAVVALADALEAAPDVELSIVTSTSPTADPQTELLARRRALVVVRALVASGVDVARLRPEVRPADDGADATDEGRVRLVTRDPSRG